MKWSLLLWAGMLVMLSLAGVGAVFAWWFRGRLPSHWSWLPSGLASPLFLACLALVVVGAALLAVLGGALWQAGKANRRTPDAEGGAVLIEFIIALPIMLMIILIMVQSMLLMSGSLVVRYAAYCAARTAIVAVPAQALPDEPRNVVSDSASSPKMNRIRAAAIWALAPVSCASDAYGGTPQNTADLAQGLSAFFQAYGAEVPGWASNAAGMGRRLSYAQEYTVVEMAKPMVDNSPYGEHEDLRIGIRHTFYLSVPYADKLFASFGESVDLGFDNSKGVILTAQARLTNEGAQDWIDEEIFPNNGIGAPG